MCDSKSEGCSKPSKPCKPAAMEKDAVPSEKSSAWRVGKIRKPFLETLKQTDKECRRAWLCCGKRTETAEEAPAGRFLKGDLTIAKAGDLELIEEYASSRRKQDTPRWRGLVALLAACIFSICGSCIMWSTDAFDNFVANEMILDKSKSTFDWWVTPPISPWFKVYIWNYTNLDEYLQNPGIKIKLQEVGPFTYRETIIRENIQFSEDGTNLTYTEAKRYEFLPDMSKGDLNGTVVVPNLSYLGAMARFSKNDFGLSLVGSAVLRLINLDKPLITLKANDFIWGYDDDLFKFSKFDPTSTVPMDRVGLLTSKMIPDTMTILTGASDIDKLSYIVRHNNKKSLGVWPDASCNKMDGTDGSMFPPRKVRAMLPVFAYKPEACRLIEFTFQKKTTAQGVGAYRYIIERNTFNSPRTYPGNLCYCNTTDQRECALDGLFDTSPCSYGAPTLISYPHFFLTDPIAAAPFEGMHPDPDEHDMFADIHPRLGMTLQGRSRLQLNVRVMKDLPRMPKGMVLPVAWFSQDLPSYDAKFKTFLIVATYGLDTIEFVLLYILPVVALITAFVIVRRLLELRGAREDTLEDCVVGNATGTSKEAIILSG